MGKGQVRDGLWTGRQVRDRYGTGKGWVMEGVEGGVR